MNEPVSSSHESLRDQFLSQVVVPDANSTYRKEIKMLLERQERGLWIESIGAKSLWVFTVLLGTIFLMIAGSRKDISPALTMALFAIFLMISAAVELLKYFISRSRVELLRAIKSLEVEVLELKAGMTRLPEQK